jgi:hypothetical protein
MNNPSNPNLTEVPQPKPGEVKFDHSNAVHVPAESFEINVDAHGTIRLAFAAVGLDPKVAHVSFVAHIPLHMVEQYVNAVGVIANRMKIKMHNSIQ